MAAILVPDTLEYTLEDKPQDLHKKEPKAWKINDKMKHAGEG